MKFLFKIGKHRARPIYWLHWFPILYKPVVVKRRVSFDFSAKYYLPGDDQNDTNKLFGVAFMRPHNRSARFGWRYDQDKNKFVLSAYCFINGERYIEDLCDLVAGKQYECWLFMTGDSYKFLVVKHDTGDTIGRAEMSTGHRCKWALLLGPYFGGNRPANTNMIINLKKF